MTLDAVILELESVMSDLQILECRHALEELKRRAPIEALTDAWLHENEARAVRRARRGRQHYVSLRHGNVVVSECLGDDYWSAAAATLGKVRSV